MSKSIPDHILIAIAGGEPVNADAFLGPDIDINAFGIHGARTALMAAAFAGNSELIRALVKQGALLDLGHTDWGTALHQAAAMGQVDAVQTLIDLGANIEAETAVGLTPLMIAAAHGQVDVVNLLLTKGANVHHHDRSGSTARTIALEKDEDKIAAILEAVESATPNSKSEST